MKRVGIIGAGQIVEDSHLPVLKNMSDVEVSWLFDVNNNRSALLSSMYQVPAISVNELESKLSEIDFCLIATPLGVRLPYLEMCSKKNVSVYVEKPFARDVNEHLQYSSLFLPHKIAIGYQRRSYSVINTIKHIFEKNIFGRLLQIDFVQSGFSMKSGGSGKFITDARLSGGGVVIESAVHILDQILYITSATEVKVGQMSSIVFENIDYDARFDSALLTNDGQVKVNCIISKLENLGQGVTYKFENAEVFHSLAADATIKINSSKSAEKSFLQIVADDQYAKTVAQSFYKFWKDFMDASSNSAVNYTSASNSISTSKWIQEIYNKMIK